MKKQIYGPQDFGEMIRAARLRKQLSQRELAAKMGVTQAWISSVEKGNEKSQLAGVLRLASYLEIDLVATLGENQKQRVADLSSYYLELARKPEKE